MTENFWFVYFRYLFSTLKIRDIIKRAEKKIILAVNKKIYFNWIDSQ